MPDLSILNIEEISRDVGRQEITFAHLRDELTDHICCDVEEEMRRGLSFAEAYAAVRKKMGSRRIREIQEETLYAVDTKYRQMKNTMKISGIAGTVLLGFASLFKIMHWPFAGILVMLGALSMAFVFMPSAFTVLWKETHSARSLYLYVSAFLTGMFFITGVVFKIQHWPGAGLVLTVAVLTGILMFLPALLAAKLKDAENNAKLGVYITGTIGIFSYAAGLLSKVQHWPWSTHLLLAGLVLIFLVAFPWYTRITWKDDAHVSTRFIYMVIGALAIMMPSLLVSLNIQNNYEGGYFVAGGQQQALYDYQSASNRLVISSCTDTALSPVLASIHSGTEKLVSVIEGIEAGMNEGSGPFNLIPYNDFLREGAAPRTELNMALQEYSSSLSALMPEAFIEEFGGLLDPAAYFPAPAQEPERVSLMAGMHMLKLLKNGILSVESHALATVSQKL